MKRGKIGKAGRKTQADNLYSCHSCHSGSDDMIRDRGIDDIYDGHFYSPEDMVPVGCSDCAGCSACCRNTGDSIILDPYDMYLLSKGTGKTFTDMIEREIEIRLVDGLILPNLMQHHEDAASDNTDSAFNPGSGDLPSKGTDTDAGPAAGNQSPYGTHTISNPAAGDQSSNGTYTFSEPEAGDHCPFLSAAGRCTIHPYRPGMCRLYPMGRYYTDGGFRYILQKDECTDRKKTPVLLRDWLGIDDLPRYEAYIQNWHDFKKQAEKALDYLTEKSRDSVTRYILQIFFVHPYLTEQDFYPQYGTRMEICRQALAQILPPA